MHVFKIRVLNIKIKEINVTAHVIFGSTRQQFCHTKLASFISSSARLAFIKRFRYFAATAIIGPHSHFARCHVKEPTIRQFVRQIHRKVSFRIEKMSKIYSNFSHHISWCVLSLYLHSLKEQPRKELMSSRMHKIQTEIRRTLSNWRFSVIQGASESTLVEFPCSKTAVFFQF